MMDELSLVKYSDDELTLKTARLTDNGDVEGSQGVMLADGRNHVAVVGWCGGERSSLFHLVLLIQKPTSRGQGCQGHPYSLGGKEGGEECLWGWEDESNKPINI